MGSLKRPPEAESQPLSSTEYRRRLFATTPRVRYGPSQAAEFDKTAASGANRGDKLHSVGSRESSEPTDILTTLPLDANPRADIPTQVPASIPGSEPVISLSDFRTVLALPMTSQYKSQLVIQTAEAVNHLRFGRVDASKGKARLLLKACAECNENAAWLLYRNQQLTPLQAAKWVLQDPTASPQQLKFTHGALAGQSWALKQLQELPPELFTHTFGVPCLTYHSTLQRWYEEMCRSRCPVTRGQIQQKLTLLVLEHRALCFAVTFLHYEATTQHNLWPPLPEGWVPHCNDWICLMDKVSLSSEQLRQCLTQRCQARENLVELELCTSLIKQDLQNRIEKPDMVVNDIQFLESVEALSNTNNRRLALEVHAANGLLFEILTPQQAALLIAGLQVDVAKRPICAWLDWIKLLSGAILSEEGRWMDAYRGK